jgi:hypothetical protein
VPILETLDEKDLAAIAKEVGVQIHRPGSVLMRQGDRGDKMFLLTGGAVHVFRIPAQEFPVVQSLESWAPTVEPSLRPLHAVRLCSHFLQARLIVSSRAKHTNIYNNRCINVRIYCHNGKKRETPLFACR